MTTAERRIREAIRWFLAFASDEQLRAELAISLEQGDALRAACVRELLEEGRSQPA